MIKKSFGAALTGTIATIYTVPSSKKAEWVLAYITNTSGSNGSVTLQYYDASEAATLAILDTYAISSKEFFQIGGAKMAKDPRLERAGVAGFNKPKRTPNHPKKSHVVVAKEGEQVKTIRFGEQGASTAGKPKAGESEAMKKKRASFKARHGKNISKGKMSAAYWADKVKW
jgi:hypothetical protein